jgi:ABC-type dipeptide/oligopeptide/nickel transport system permease subunit
MKIYVYMYYSKGPLQIIIALVLLYQQMQWSIFPGIALLILMIPINLFLQSIQKKLTV